MLCNDLFRRIVMPFDGCVSYLEEGLANSQIFVSPTILITFDRPALGIARMFFVDIHGVHQQPPEGLTVLKGDVPVTMVDGGFFLSWEQDYDIVLNNEVFLRLIKQKQHSISLKAPALRLKARMAADLTAALQAEAERVEETTARVGTLTMG